MSHNAATSREILFCETCWSHQRGVDAVYEGIAGPQNICRHCGQKTLISDVIDLRTAEINHFKSLAQANVAWSVPPAGRNR